MSEQVYDVPAEWKKRAFIDAAKYAAMYQRSVKDPNGFWGEQAKRIDWIKPFTKVKNTSFDPHNVSIKWFEDGVTNVAHNCLDRHLAKRGDQVAIIWEGDDPEGRPQDHLPRAARRGVPVRQCAEGARRQEGRPRHHLSADDPGGRLSRCSPARASARSIRWCSAASRRTRSPAASRMRSRRIVITADEGLRGGRKVPLKANADAAADRAGGVATHDRGAPHRRRRDHEGGPRRLLRRDRQDGAGRMPVRADERRGSAVHPLHVGLDRQAQGRAAHHRRLSRCSPRSRTNTCSTITTATSTGAPPTSAG